MAWPIESLAFFIIAFELLHYVLAKHVHRGVERTFLQIDIRPCHSLVYSRHAAQIVSLDNSRGVRRRVGGVLQLNLLPYYLSDALNSDEKYAHGKHKSQCYRERSPVVALAKQGATLEENF